MQLTGSGDSCVDLAHIRCNSTNSRWEWAPATGKVRSCNYRCESDQTYKHRMRRAQLHVRQLQGQPTRLARGSTRNSAKRSTLVQSWLRSVLYRTLPGPLHL